MLTKHPDWPSMLVAWYRASARPLPWRSNPTPYRVWVSEVMLQQTRIEAVIPYFERFMKELPTVESLATVPDDKLMKLWEGLGYYSRARNLKKAAQRIMAEHDGVIPPDFAALHALPGFGDYTAGAVASIAFGIAVPAVDGNVLRVMARLLSNFDDILLLATRKRMTAILREWIPADTAGDFNAGLMELGERVCLPNTAPHCEECPLFDVCRGRADGVADKLPVRAPRKARHIENRTVLMILSDEPTPRVLLHRRPSKGLLAGLWELPNYSGTLLAKEIGETVLALGGTPKEMRNVGTGVHLFTHIEWQMTGTAVYTPMFSVNEEYAWATLTQLDETFALPKAFRPFSRLLPILLEKRDV